MRAFMTLLVNIKVFGHCKLDIICCLDSRDLKANDTILFMVFSVTYPILRHMLLYIDD